MRKFDKRIALFLSTTALPLVFAPGYATAQSKTDDQPVLEEVVVTAQRREEDLQDVPIAITAFTAESLQANRIFTVQDLSGLAPGTTVRPSPGGIGLAAITMRGQASFGVVAGSDKQVSIYLDGVYLSNPRGSIFDLPDVERIEVLRGPQGTLFGRNATGGAVSVTTRDPSGTEHAKVEGTYGNYDQYRVRVSVDTPQVGPFSAYVSFVRRYQRGDIENAGAGLVWDRTLSPSNLGVHTSPRWLGTVDTNSYFGALKFEPSDNFKIIYKFDRNEDNGTPEAVAFAGYDPKAPLTGALVTALLNSQPFPVYTDPSGLRPKIVNNGYMVARDQLVQGHSLTATWRANDSLTFKDVFAYRTASVFAPDALDGLSTLTFTQAAVQPFALLAAASSVPNFFTLPPTAQGAILGQIGAGLQSQVGNRFAIITSEARSESKQWSDELTVNYQKDKLQVTAGALWFHSRDDGGGPVGMAANAALSFFPVSGLVPLGNEGLFANGATSLAAYTQLEYQFTDQLGAVVGGRVTHDRKTFNFTFGPYANPTTIVAPTYTKTKPNYTVGVNYKPIPDVLTYAKYSTSFVSGGDTAGVTYAPEEAKSVEVGAKAELLDRRLQTNVALFHVDYDHYQLPEGTTQPQSAALIVALATPLYGAAIANQLPATLSTFVADSGTLTAQGVEAEITAAPARGMTLGGSLAYTYTHFSNVPAIVLATDNNQLATILRPEWTGTLWAMYETRPVFGASTLLFRADGNYQSKELFDTQPKGRPAPLQVGIGVPGYWILNARAALRHIQVGRAEAELAVWGRNLSDRRYANEALIQALATSLNFIPARTFGLDFSLDF